MARPPLWPYLVLATLAFGVYANSLANGFVSDDNFQLLNNPLVTDWKRIPQIFSSHIWAFAGQETTNYYRPIQMVLYMALYYLVGFDAFTFHLVMIAVHVANTLAVYRLAGFFLNERNPALVAAAVFAVHPIHTEAVVWVAVLPDVLLTLLVICSLWLFVQQEARPRGRQIAVHCGIFFLALLTKEPGAMLLPMLAAYEALYLRRPLLDLWKNRALYLGLAATFAAYLGLRINALGSLAPAQGFYFRLTPWEHVLSAAVLFGKYVRMLIWPTGLNYYHLFEKTSSLTLPAVASLLAVAMIATGIALRRGLISCALAWMVLPLLPVLNITGVGENVFTERYLYLPSVAFVLLVGAGWKWFVARQRPVAWGAAALVVVAGSYGTLARNPDWHDDIRLFTVSSQQSPKSGTLVGNLGWFHLQSGNADKAIELYSRAIQLQPQTALFHNNLGNALMMKRRHDEAVESIRRAVTLKPDYAEGHMNLGLALEAAGRNEEAVASHLRAIQLKPRYAEPRTAMALIRMREKKYDEAHRLLKEALDVNPRYTEAWINLGVIYNDTQRYAEGAQAFRTAIAVGPRFNNIYIAHFNLGISYSHLNSLEAAAVEYAAAARLKPDFAPAREALARVQEELKAKGGSLK